jgi:hypothetical protein
MSWRQTLCGGVPHVYLHKTVKSPSCWMGRCLNFEHAFFSRAEYVYDTCYYAMRCAVCLPNQCSLVIFLCISSNNLEVYTQCSVGSSEYVAIHLRAVSKQDYYMRVIRMWLLNPDIRMKVSSGNWNEFCRYVHREVLLPAQCDFSNANIFTNMDLYLQ